MTHTCAMLRMGPMGRRRGEGGEGGVSWKAHALATTSCTFSASIATRPLRGEPIRDREGGGWGASESTVTITGGGLVGFSEKRPCWPQASINLFIVAVWWLGSTRQAALIRRALSAWAFLLGPFLPLAPREGGNEGAFKAEEGGGGSAGTS